ncbi:albusnodin/ikarugamycin family macrolactam cyclase [Nocardiopsis kunsanensis]|uniref:albusnodin/ikarugamycin family macrolactam cyclase n=1 Tax=Nocardiopsis kunsanensis TaxID=141693 RepID=UPI00037E7818|nr:albusnodin/ikarugamycin family macrolactam cyclase [Nocardiopsis kunsanensis]
MWFGGTTGPQMHVRPAGAQPVTDLPSLWLSPEYPDPHMVIPYRDRGSGLIVIGMCGADVHQVQRAVAHGVPNDVAWRWAGSYIVAEVTPDGVTLWTDLGATPLYTRRTAHGLIWSSSARMLASLHGDPEISLTHMAARVAGDQFHGSCFEHVDPLAFGHRVRLSGRNVEQRPVWRPAATDGVDHGRRLRSALESAVSVRIESGKHPSTDFSGGFDSTALGLVAAARLALEGRHITGVTLHPEGVFQGGDLDYARESIPHQGLRHRWMPIRREHLPYTDLDLVPATDEPAPSTVSYAHFSAQLVWLAEQGSDMHMTGDGGDGLLLTPPSHIAYLMRHKKPWAALGEAARWAQIRRTSIWDALQNARSTPQVRTPFDLESPTK